MFPLCRKLVTRHGPHSSCLMSAETYWARFPHRHPQSLHTSFYGSTRRCLLTQHQRQAVFLGSFLVTTASFCLLALLSLLGYASLRASLRFQRKLALFLIMLERAPFEFKRLNRVFLFCFHLCLFFTGGLGLLLLSFVDT